MKVLIGIDESPHSRETLEFTKRIPWPADTRFIVLSAVRPIAGAYSEIYVPAVPPDYDRLMLDLRKIHEEVASDAGQSLKSAGLRTEVRVVTGDPRNTLVDTAKTEGADLVIVGSHGRTGVAKLLLGSVASHVVTHAPCGVLVVKAPKESTV